MPRSSLLVPFFLLTLLFASTGLTASCGKTQDADRQRAERALENVRARLAVGQTFVTDEDFDFALSYYETADDSVRLFEAYQFAAIKMRWLGRQDSMATYLLKAIEMAPDTASSVRSDLYTKLSNVYAYPSMPKDYEAAVRYAKCAMAEASKPGQKARALHDIGLFYSFANENDSAVYYMERALEESDTDSPEYAAYALNYANTAGADFDKSVAFLQNLKGGQLGRLITLGQLYFNHARTDSARWYLDMANKLYKENPAAYSINTYNSLRLLDQCVQYGETGRVPQYDAVANDSVNELLEIRHKIEAEQQEYNTELQMNLLKSKAQRRRAWNIALGLVLFLSACFGVSVWHSKRKFLKLKRQLDKVKVEQIVAEANDEIQAGTRSQDLLRQRLDLCVEQFRLSKLQTEIDKMEMQFRTADTLPPLKAREKVQKGLIACFADFIVDLKLTGAKLNVDDIVTCIMAGLNESNAAIAACLGTTDTAVRTRKTRLRTKLPTDVLKLLDL